MSISIIFIHVNNFSIILICNEKTGIFFWYKLQYIERYTIFNINLSNINKNVLKNSINGVIFQVRNLK